MTTRTEPLGFKLPGTSAVDRVSHPQHSANPSQTREGAAPLPLTPSRQVTRVQCAACGHTKGDKRALRPQERASLLAVKRAWRTAADESDTTWAELAERFDRSPQYVSRCFSDAFDDAPRAEWMALVPDAMFVALMLALRTVKPRAIVESRPEALIPAVRKADEASGKVIARTMKALEDNRIDADEAAEIATLADEAKEKQHAVVVSARAVGGAS